MTTACPNCGKALPEATLRQSAAELGSRRKRFGGPPKSKDRCPCGEMTLARAAKRHHKCQDINQLAPKGEV